MNRVRTLFAMKRNRFVSSVTTVNRGAPDDPHRDRSRPRVEGDREQEILDATLEVLADVGYDRLTMDAVAARAKASKATLYRRWNNKVSLVIDALAAQKGAAGRPRHRHRCAATCSRCSAAWRPHRPSARWRSSPA